MIYEDKFVGFVDILGFKQMIEKSVGGNGMTLTEVLALLETFGSSEARSKFDKYGPMICPSSKHQQRHLDFRVTQISDCMIVSSEVSPAGAINLVAHCWAVVLKLLEAGRMCRGYITRGAVYHTDTQIIGTAYQEAYTKEAQVTAFRKDANERGTPFVEIDSSVQDYVVTYGDKCVKEMFSRYVTTDGDVAAIFPFQRLAHSFVIGGYGQTFDAMKEKESNQNMRMMIERLKQGIATHIEGAGEKASRKAEHYIKALDVQLAVCLKTDEFIDALNSPFPARRV